MTAKTNSLFIVSAAALVAAAAAVMYRSRPVSVSDPGVALRAGSVEQTPDNGSGRGVTLAAVDARVLDAERSHADPGDGDAPARDSDAEEEVSALEDLELLHASFEQIYAGMTRRELQQALVDRWLSTDLAAVRAAVGEVHQAKIAEGDFETLDVAVRNGEFHTFPINKHSKKGERVLLVMYHGGDYGGDEPVLIRTTISRDELGPSRDAVEEVHWLHDRARRRDR